jgi:orotidine-5'-phosphate decarboxylase
MMSSPQLCLALDVPSVDAARAVIAELGDRPVVYKIGYALAFTGGLAFAEELANKGRSVFLDLKLHDIGNTVKSGVERLAERGLSYLTVHGYPQTMRAAVEGRGASSLKLLGVTVLTSYDDTDLMEAGYGHGVQDVVMQRVVSARDCGMDGIVCSAQDLPHIRPVSGKLTLVTPGIRLEGGDSGDQKRVMTPRRAVMAGAGMLVVGRPILAAEKPAKAADEILFQMERASS